MSRYRRAFRKRFLTPIRESNASVVKSFGQSELQLVAKADIYIGFA